MEKLLLKEEKRSLRSKTRHAMALMSAAALAASDAALCKAFLALPQLERAKCVLIYDGIGAEVRTRSLRAALEQRGLAVCYPLCMPAWQMQARRVASLADLVPDVYEIPAPRPQCPVVSKSALDLILVPALCCDEQGYRLGQGGGYYDRYLQDYEGMTVAFCRAELLQKKLAHADFDVPMDLVLTENEQFWRATHA